MYPTNIVFSADGLLRVHHVAKRLQVPLRTVRHWARKGRLVGRKAGPKIWVFHPDAVEALRLELITTGRARHSGVSAGIGRP